MSIDQNSAGEETKSDDIDDLGPVSPSANDHTTSIVGLWDIAFIHAFTCTFSALDDPGLHAPPNFQPEVKASQFLLNFNPMAGNIDFEALEPIIKIEILRSLVEWQLEDCNAIRAAVEKYCRASRYDETNPIDLSPIGMDSKKRIYWQFGDSARLWREKIGVKTNQRSQWEIATKTLDDLICFAESLKDTTNRTEKKLYLNLVERIIPGIQDSTALREKSARKQRTKERAMEIQFSNDPMTLRSRNRKPVRYQFDDIYNYDLEDDVYEEEMEDGVLPVRTGTRSSRRIAQKEVTPERTRSSSRLHSENNESLEETFSDSSILGIENGIDAMNTDAHLPEE
ncbi:hypothetical protein Unana1_07426 [Umbelopsis nana]